MDTILSGPGRGTPCVHLWSQHFNLWILHKSPLISSWTHPLPTTLCCPKGKYCFLSMFQNAHICFFIYLFTYGLTLFFPPTSEEVAIWLLFYNWKCVYFNFFYWNVAYWQCCDSFKWTMKGFSHTYTCIQCSSNSPPIQTSTKYWVEFHVLYSRSLWVIHLKYNSVYMLIPNLLTAPPPIIISSLSKSVSLFLFCK